MTLPGFMLLLSLLVLVAPAAAKVKVVGNLDSVTYYTSSLPFSNVMLASSYIYKGIKDAPPTVDRNGWMTEMPAGVSQVSLWAMEGLDGAHAPKGIYEVRWDGSGDIRFGYAAHNVLSQGEGTARFEYDPNSAGGRIRVYQNSIEASDHVRNIRVFLPGGICEGDPFHRVESADACSPAAYLPFADHPENLFNPDFLQALKGYSIIRFMDWNRTNGSDEKDWSDRTLPKYGTIGHEAYGPVKAAPYEFQIALCNILDADYWVNVPALATDDYVTHLATLIKTKLDTGLKVYVEYSNETWNSARGFSQHQDTIALRDARTPGITRSQFVALRSRQIGESFKRILGSDRVVSVLGGQAANSDQAGVGMAYLGDRFGADNTGIDAVAITSYLGGITSVDRSNPPFSDFDDDGVFALWRKKLFTNLYAYVTNHKKLTDQYGVRLIAYEGGIYAATGGREGDALNTFVDSLCADPRMKMLVTSAINGVEARGMDTYAQYVAVEAWSRFGRWGAMQYLDSSLAESPARDAILTYSETAATENQDSQGRN